MTQGRPEGWIDNLEIEDANIRWGFSNFAGEKRLYNKEGEHFFVINLTEDEAVRYSADGWNVRQRPAQEEGDPDEYTLEIKISDNFGMPLIYFIKNARKYPVDYMEELKQIRPGMVTQVDFIASPGKPWLDEKASMEAGYDIFKRTAYCKELYVTMIQSRFGQKYDDYEEVRPSSE